MLKKILLDQERLLVHDQLSYMAGPVKILSEIVLTNHRILVLPHKDWSKSLGYQRRNIIWEDVQNVSLSMLDKNLQIETRLQKLSLWGVGARRMFEWIEQWRNSGLSLETPWNMLERRQVVLSDEVLISIGIGLAVTGELTITRRGIKLRYQTLETKEQMIKWSDMTDLSYTAVSQKLKFSANGNRLTLQGNQAQLINHIIDVFSKQDTFVDCLWESSWESAQGSNNGFIMMGQQALYLFPCSKQASLTNKPYVRIPCAKIQHLEREDGEILKLYTSKGQTWTLSLSVPDLWMGYMERLLLHFWNAQSNALGQNQFFCTKMDNKKEALTMGRMSLDDNNITFQPNGLRPKREIPVYEVIKMNKRSSRLTIQEDVLPESFEFLDEDQVAQMAALIEPKLSPMSVSFVGKNEPTESVLGKIKQLSVYMDGSLLVTIKNSIIEENNGIIYIQCNQFEEKIFIPHNVRVEVDVISKQGHYIFHALVLENNLNTPDIDGKFSLMTQQIGHVRLINQRAAFRIPTKERIRFEVQNCPIELESDIAQFVDLSAGGCQLEYRYEMDERDFQRLKSPKTTIVVYIPLEEAKRRSRGNFTQLTKQKIKIEQVAFPAKIRRLFQPEDEDRVVMGLEFLENAPSAEHRLMRKILTLERALIQHHRRILVRGERE